MMTPIQKADEVFDRVKRIETRLTNYLTSVGFDTQSTPCKWTWPNKVVIPTERVSVRDVIATIPLDVSSETVVEVWCKEVCLMVLHASPRKWVAQTTMPVVEPLDRAQP